MKKFDWEAFQRGEIEVYFYNDDERNDFVKKLFSFIEDFTKNPFTGLTEERSYGTDYIYCETSPWDTYIERTIVEWSDYMSKEFTKADLEPFMLVVTRDKSIFMVTDKCLVDEDGYFVHLSDISDTLTNDFGSNDNDIMEVYPKPKHFSDYLRFNISKRGEPIYVRKETKKMTLKEVCDELGYDVEIIKDKE